jgi:hypothetical protein
MLGEDDPPRTRMAPDPNRPEKLLAVANEIEATGITSALAEYGIEAFAVGGYTAGFKAEAPGTVAVMVRHADFDRAKQALKKIEQEQRKIDWANVDVMWGVEEEPPGDEEAEAETHRQTDAVDASWVLEAVVVLLAIGVILITLYAYLASVIHSCG